MLAEKRFDCGSIEGYLDAIFIYMKQESVIKMLDDNLFRPRHQRSDRR